MNQRIFGDAKFLLVGKIEVLPLNFRGHFHGDRRLLLKIAPTLRSAIAVVRTERFDCIIVDREVEDGDGLVLAPTIRRIQPRATSILLSEKAQWATIEAAQDLGYSEVIVKSLLEAELTNRIIAHLKPESEKDRSVLHKKSKVHLLSLREREILNDIATGATTEEIALRRHNSIATIKSHLTSIYRKLEVRNRVEAIAELRKL